jgi:methanol metabolism-related c-type cytochrome
MPFSPKTNKHDGEAHRSPKEPNFMSKRLAGAALILTALVSSTPVPSMPAHAQDAKPADAKPAAAAKPDASADKPPYTIENGRVDKGTFNGYRRYGESCLRCHGPDGAGSSYAPDLTETLKTMSKDTFEETVVNGRKNVNTANNNVMPSFGTTDDVVLYIDDIYAYLKARADGKLPRGRPKRIGEDDD